MVISISWIEKSGYFQNEAIHRWFLRSPSCEPHGLCMPSCTHALAFPCHPEMTCLPPIFALGVQDVIRWACSGMQAVTNSQYFYYWDSSRCVSFICHGPLMYVESTQVLHTPYIMMGDRELTKCYICLTAFHSFPFILLSLHLLQGYTLPICLKSTYLLSVGLFVTAYHLII